MTPKRSPQNIPNDYRKLKDSNDFNLKAFIEDNFYHPIAEKIFANTEETYYHNI